MKKMKPSTKKYLCRHCKTLEVIPDMEFGIKLHEIQAVYCPKCSAKGYKRKMKEVTG